MVRLRSPAPAYMGEFPSGQRGQTVNLLSLTSLVRIQLPPPNKNTDPRGRYFYLSRELQLRTRTFAFTRKCLLVRIPLCGIFAKGEYPASLEINRPLWSVFLFVEGAPTSDKGICSTCKCLLVRIPLCGIFAKGEYPASQQQKRAFVGRQKCVFVE